MEPGAAGFNSPSQEEKLVEAQQKIISLQEEQIEVLSDLLGAQNSEIQARRRDQVELASLREKDSWTGKSVWPYFWWALLRNVWPFSVWYHRFDRPNPKRRREF